MKNWGPYNAESGREVVQEEEEGGLMSPSHSNVLLQLSIIHARGNERPCHPFSLISILQLFDRRNQRALAPTETLLSWATSVYIYMCMHVCVRACMHVIQHFDVLLLMNWTA